MSIGHAKRQAKTNTCPMSTYGFQPIQHVNTQTNLSTNTPTLATTSLNPQHTPQDAQPTITRSGPRQPQRILNWFTPRQLNTLHSPPQHKTMTLFGSLLHHPSPTHTPLHHRATPITNIHGGHRLTLMDKFFWLTFRFSFYSSFNTPTSELHTCMIH